MTREPEALTASDRIAFAVHCMSVAGYRTVPLVDAERRPIGVVTVNDVIRWLAGPVSRGGAEPAAGRRAQAPPRHGRGLAPSLNP